MQQIIITGYLSRDAEQRQTQGGQSVTTLNIPVKQGWGDKEQTNWFRASVWGKRADFAAKFRKGEFVTVVGELAIGEYNGKPQYEINASDFHSVRTAPRDTAEQGGTPAADYGKQPAYDEDASDIPFITNETIF
jgi:single-strand DNA-binding protein